MNKPALKMTEFTVVNGRDAMDVLANGADIARHEYPVSPLIYRAASELIGRDDRGLKTNIQSYGLPHVVLSDVAEQLESLGVSSFASTQILDALSTYAVGLGAEFAREAQAKPLYARIMVTDKKPDDLPDCALVQTTLIDGTRRVGDGVSQRVMQSTIYGTRTSMTRSMEVDEMLASSQKKWLLIFYGSPTQEGDRGFNGQGLNSNDVALINLVQGLGGSGTIPGDTLQELEKIIRDGEENPTHFDVVRLIENFALIQNMIEPYRDAPETIPSPAQTALSTLIARSYEQLSLISGDATTPLLTTSMMATLASELETFATTYKIILPEPFDWDASISPVSSLIITNAQTEVIIDSASIKKNIATNDPIMDNDQTMSFPPSLLPIIETLIEVREQASIEGMAPDFLLPVINDPAVIALMDTVKATPITDRPTLIERLTKNPALSEAETRLKLPTVGMDVIVVSLSQPLAIPSLKSALDQAPLSPVSSTLAQLIRNVETLQTTAPTILENSLSRIIAASLENSAKPAPPSSPTLSIPAIVSLAAIIPTLPVAQREQMAKTINQGGVAGLMKEVMIAPQPSSSPSGLSSPAVAILQTLAITHPAIIKNMIERNAPSTIQPSSFTPPKAEGTITLSTPSPLSPMLSNDVAKIQTQAMVTQALLSPDRSITKTPQGLQQQIKLVHDIQAKGLTAALQASPALAIQMQTILAPVVADRVGMAVKQSASIPMTERAIIDTALAKGGIATLAKPEILNKLSPTTRETVLRTMEQTLSVAAGMTTLPVIQRAIDAVRVSLPTTSRTPTVAELIRQSSPLSFTSQPSSFSSPKMPVAQMVEALKDASKLREFLSNPVTRQNPSEYVHVLRAIPPEILPNLPPQERQMVAEAKVTLSAMVLEQSLVKMAAEGQPINRATIQHLSQAIATGQPSAIEKAIQQVTETLARTNTPVPLAVAEVNAAIRSFASSPDMPPKSAPVTPPLAKSPDLEKPDLKTPDLPKFTTLYTPPSFPTGDTTIKVDALKTSLKPDSIAPCNGGPNCPHCAAVFAAAVGKGEAPSPSLKKLDKTVPDALKKIRPESNDTGKTTPTFNNHASGCGCNDCAINEIGKKKTDKEENTSFKGFSGADELTL